MISKLKENKAIVGMAVAIILAMVLVSTIPLTNNAVPENAVPGNNIAATVNGEVIMQEDVAEMQELYGMQEEQALEQLIMLEVLYQAAELGDYIPTREEVEQELEAQLAMMGMSIEDFQEILEEEDICYEEYLEDYGAQLAIEDYLYDTVEVPEVSEEEAREFYEAWKQSFPEAQEPPPFEEIKSEIIMHLGKEKQQEAMFLLIEELIAEADIEYM